MKIKSVLIDGFKNLSKVRIEFTDITALVALNNFGKSNVLDAIAFGLEFIKGPIGEKDFLMAHSNLIPINRKTAGRNYKFEIEFLTGFNAVEHNVIYGYEFAWKYSKKTEPAIVSEYLKIRPTDKGKKYTKLINRDTYRATYKSSDTGRCISKINVGSTELVVNKLLAFDDIFSANLIREINNIKFYPETNLDVKNLYQPDPIIRKGLEDMSIAAANLPRVIYHLREKYKDKFDLLVDVYRDLFPNVEEIIVKQYKINPGVRNKLPEDAPFVMTDVIYVLFVKEKDLIQPLNFAMMSDGSKRVFLILTKIILANIFNISLLAIEEPENSVHPSLLQSYIRIIRQLLVDCKVIITSHSPYIVSYLEPEWIYVGVSKYPGIAEFFALKKSGQKLLQQDAADFDMSMGDYIFSMMADEESDWKDYLECSNHA